MRFMTGGTGWVFFIHSRRRSYYLFLTICLLLVCVTRISGKERGARYPYQRKRA